MFERGALLNKLLFTKVLFRNYSVAVAPKKVFVYILFAVLLFLGGGVYWRQKDFGWARNDNTSGL